MTIFYLIVALVLPGVAGEPPKLAHQLVMTRQCPEQKAFQAQFEEMQKNGTILRYSVICAKAPSPEGTPS